MGRSAPGAVGQNCPCEVPLDCISRRRRGVGGVPARAGAAAIARTPSSRPPTWTGVVRYVSGLPPIRDTKALMREAVIANGTAAAERFLASWDWDAFQRACPPHPGRLRAGADSGRGGGHSRGGDPDR